MPDIPAIQAALQQFGIDGWLLYDFRGSNPLARRVLHISDGAMLTRRWFYFIPARGEPQKLLHRIEPKALDHLPGLAKSYLKWQQFEAGVGELVRGAKTVAMEYVPRNANPYVSRVDAGTVEGGSPGVGGLLTIWRLSFTSGNFVAELYSSGNYDQVYSPNYGDLTQATFRLILDPNFTDAGGDQFTLASAINSFFFHFGVPFAGLPDGTPIPDGTTITVNGKSFTIHYVNNSVVLTANP